jgi:hypothetical protein
VAIRRNFFDVFNKSMEHASTVQTRLHAIFGEQEWDAMAKSYWIRQALDLLLSVVESHGPRSVQLAGGCAQPPPLPRRGVEHASVVLRDDDAEPFRRFMQQQSAFLVALPQLSLLDDMLSPLKDLLHQDVTLASYLWQLLFPQLWHQLTTSERRVLGDEISSVLQKDYHMQSRQPPNVACTLLDGLSRCAVPPPVKPELAALCRPHVWRVAHQPGDARAAAGAVLRRAGDWRAERERRRRATTAASTRSTPRSTCCCRSASATSGTACGSGARRCRRRAPRCACSSTSAGRTRRRSTLR